MTGAGIVMPVFEFAATVNSSDVYSFSINLAVFEIVLCAIPYGTGMPTYKTGETAIYDTMTMTAVEALAVPSVFVQCRYKGSRLKTFPCADPLYRIDSSS